MVPVVDALVPRPEHGHKKKMPVKYCSTRVPSMGSTNQATFVTCTSNTAPSCPLIEPSHPVISVKIGTRTTATIAGRSISSKEEISFIPDDTLRIQKNISPSSQVVNAVSEPERSSPTEKRTSSPNPSKKTTMDAVEVSGRQERSSFTDLGCMMPEEGYDFFNPEEDDDVTVVMGNLDQRPAHISNLEKLTNLSAITQEEKDARDRQLIQMYTREGQYPGATRRRRRFSAPTRNQQDRSESYRSLLSEASNGTCTSAQASLLPENYYPYYDLVVMEPKQVFDESFQSTDSEEATPEQQHEVILPPFSPRKRSSSRH